MLTDEVGFGVILDLNVDVELFINDVGCDLTQHVFQGDIFL